MALKGFLVLILVIVVTYLAATFVVTTGAMIAARCLPQNDARPLADTLPR